MPILTIISNQNLDTDSGQLELLSKTVSRLLGKPESYIMVSIQHNPNMIFAGSHEPLAFCELKSLGLRESQTPNLSRQVCDCLTRLYNIPINRIYIEFSAPPRAMWGWDGRTF
jgi:phenylpyruvate tautomerase PptA (4-oxalocrotonate tautomerase family)